MDGPAFNPRRAPTAPPPTPPATPAPVAVRRPGVSGLRRVLAEAAERSGRRRVLVLTHTSPDPDALGACVGARALVERGCSLDAEILTIGRIHRAENVAMVRELGLRFDDYSAVDPAAVCGAVLVDTQPGFGHTRLPEGVPVLAVFDHHVSPEGSALAAVPHVDLRTELGSTSSLVYSYLRDAGVELDRHTATALHCGVRFDTGDLSVDVTPLDEEAYLETFRRADRAALARIRRPRLPAQYYSELQDRKSVV